MSMDSFHKTAQSSLVQKVQKIQKSMDRGMGSPMLFSSDAPTVSTIEQWMADPCNHTDRSQRCDSFLFSFNLFY